MPPLRAYAPMWARRSLLYGRRMSPPSARAEEVRAAAAVPPIDVASPEIENVKLEPPAPSPVEKPVSAPKPKPGVPEWVWGMGAVVIVLIAGAALTMSGAIALPGQQAAAPQATAIPAATARATRAPASAPTPIVEPEKILLGRESVAKTVEADELVIVE